MQAQLKKGILEMCILAEITKKEQYGYDLIKSITQSFPDVDQSTIYAILRRLNSDGYTITYLGEVSGGPQRKYYKITSSGLEYLKQGISDWDMVSNAVEKIFNGIQESINNCIKGI